jgi:lipopolysaccharide biosynthesis glycosyltransferase
MTFAIPVVMAADKSYRIPFHVTLTSLRHNLPGDKQLHVILLSRDLQVKDIAWRNRSPGDTLRVIEPIIESDAVLPVALSDHVSVSTYYRLFLDRVVGDEWTRVIYLDSDLIVDHDISPLYHAALDGRTVGAVAGISLPTIGSLPEGHIFHRLGIDANLPYFNAGVMVIDRQKWRDKKVEERCLEFLSVHRDAVKYWDQDALNYVLREEWAALDPRWNRTSDYHSLMKKGELDRIVPRAAKLRSPFIVHFISGYKPWSAYRHPDKRLYDRYLALSGFGNHRFTFLKAARGRLGRLFQRSVSRPSAVI